MAQGAGLGPAVAMTTSANTAQAKTQSTLIFLSSIRLLLTLCSPRTLSWLLYRSDSLRTLFWSGGNSNLSRFPYREGLISPFLLRDAISFFNFRDWRFCHNVFPHPEYCRNFLYWRNFFFSRLSEFCTRFFYSMKG